MSKFLYVSRRKLLLFAGTLWVIAGVNVLLIGVKAWVNTDYPSFIIKAISALVVFTTFFLAIFKPLHKKYSLRIHGMKEKNHPLSFFNAKGWGIMFFMITLGICVRKFSLMPEYFIAFFYTGLATALTTTGVLFINSSFKYSYKQN